MRGCVVCVHRRVRGRKGGNEVAVWELAKGVVRTTISVLEVRTGTKVELQEPRASGTRHRRRHRGRSSRTRKGGD
jgi:hypothetical protein